MKTEKKKSKLHGDGIFATANIKKDEIIERCSVICLNRNDTRIIDKTALFNYYFTWENNGSAIALGNGSIYNHSHEPNARYVKDFSKSQIAFIAIKPIIK